MKHPIPNFVLLLAAVIGCFATIAQAATDPSFLLTATSKDFANYFPGQLANGYLSTMTAPRGTEGNLAYLVAFMDYAKDDMSRPAAIPGWTEIDYSTGQSDAGHFWMNQVDLDSSVFQDYQQVLDLHDATLTTSYRYLDHGKATRIKVVTLVSEASPHLAASQISITPDFDGVVQLSFAFNLWAQYQPRLPLAKLSGDEMQIAVAAHNLTLQAVPPATPDRAAVWYHGDTHVLADDGDSKNLTLWLDGRAEQGLGMAEAAAISLPAGLTPVEVTLNKGIYRLSLDLRVQVRKGQTYTFTKYVATSREDWGGDAKADLALAKAARTAGFDALLDAHKAAWANLWKTDIRIDGDPNTQRVVHSDLYYLLANAAPDTAWAIGACGLTTGYVGHIFWDSDSWIFPALVLLHPRYAKSLVMFRDRTLPAAQQRARARGLQGAMYPWEADPENGTEQVVHAAWVLGEREIHVNADVAIAQWQYYLASGDQAWLKSDGWPVIRDVARYWTSRVNWNPGKQRYDILHVTSVEENYNDVPNDTFTNADAAKALRIATAAAAVVGEQPDPRWADIAAKLYLPFSASGQHYLDMDETVQHDLGGSDLTFLAFPSLDLPMSEQVRRNDYAIAMKPMETSERIPTTMGLGPAPIAAAANGNAAEAARWIARNAADDMFKPPFNVRPETATNNTGYFLTGSGGFVQGLLYGLTGLRIEPNGLLETYPPVLPPTWKSMTLKDITFRGKHYDITLDRDASGKTRLTRKAL
ncbi:glycoside hydrolase family 65 protein [Dyella sp. S184]|uniref:glycoside hydrolase family 65 protein n=1 Tax=Dyella sp. S184 TaxID=1641862 RepID=UPI00131BD756|nr:glycoside hydrolase family 65 protein [Dyella sp. S184]